jgi:hypothetical protein
VGNKGFSGIYKFTFIIQKAGAQCMNIKGIIPKVVKTGCGLLKFLNKPECEFT